MSKHISIFLGSLEGGGAQRVMLNLGHEFVERGIKVDLVLAKAVGAYLEDVPSGIKIINLESKRVLTSLPKLVKYLRREKPDALLSSLEHTNLVAIWATWFAGLNTKLVVTVHNTLSQANINVSNLRRWATRHLINEFYPWADAVVVVSEGAREDLLRITTLNPEQVQTIYNPVVTPSLLEKAKTPLDHPWFAPGEKPVVLGIGRLTEQKDFPNLIRAFAKVREQYPARLVILGEGEDKLMLESLVSKLDVKDDVHFSGFVNNPYTYMAHAAVFVLSSKWEGLPTVLIEALATGTPVVATDCKSGPREILDNGRYGKIVPIENDDALAAGILEVIQQKNVSTHSDEIKNRFSTENSVNKYLQVLQCESE